MEDKVKSGRVPAPAVRECRDFQTQVVQFLDGQLQLELDKMIAPENRYKLTHGVSWGAPTDGGPDRFERATGQTSMNLAALANQELDAVGAILSSLSEQMNAAIIGGLYETVSEAADKVGNVVSSRQQGSAANAFLEMLRKLEFGVDRQGRVSFPSLHVHPEAGAKLLAELQAQGPDFHEEVRRVQKEKVESALAREQERLGKYLD
jgi:hypothetical protein